MNPTPRPKPSHCAASVGPGRPQHGTCGMCQGLVVVARGGALLCPRCDGTTGAQPEAVR